VGRAAAVAAAVVALAAATAALADDPTVRINAADQAKARASLLRASDLGAGWTGGPRKPDPLKAPSCPGFDPKESDLVITGHADATYKKQGVEVDSDVQVMQNAAAVRTDFSRTVRPPLAACLGHIFAQAAGAGAKVVSAKRVAFPRIGAVSAAFRVTTDVTSGSQTVRLLVDFVFVGQGRTEYSLSVIAPAQAQADVGPFEQRLARALVLRTKA
jgi:hypothetical protein